MPGRSQVHEQAAPAAAPNGRRPHGVRFRNEEQAMRAKMVEKDWVEAVIGQGPNLFDNSPMESCIAQPLFLCIHTCTRQRPRTGKPSIHAASRPISLTRCIE